MPQANIERTPTEEERRDYRPIGEKDYTHKFAREVANEQQKFVKVFKPYCARCARLDFEDKSREAQDELKRKMGHVDMQDKSFANLFPFDYEKYGDESRFKVITETEVMENKLIDGVRVPYKTGYNVDYVCKNRGCGITVFVPIYVHEERKRKSSTKKENK